MQFLSFLCLLESQRSDLEFVACLSLLIRRLLLGLTIEPIAGLIARLQGAETFGSLLHFGIIGLASSQKLKQSIPRFE